MLRSRLFLVVSRAKTGSAPADLAPALKLELIGLVFVGFFDVFSHPFTRIVVIAPKQPVGCKEILHFFGVAVVQNHGTYIACFVN